MPLFEFECKSCARVIEALVKSHDDMITCEFCGAEEMRKLISVPSTPSVKSESLPVATRGESCGAPRCCGGGCDV